MTFAVAMVDKSIRYAHYLLTVALDHVVTFIAISFGTVLQEDLAAIIQLSVLQRNYDFC